MSYTRTSHDYITVHYSDTVSYPPSQSGGTIHVSGSVTEPVTINVHVDTSPFDVSVNNCTNSVNVLTGSVVATEAAQVASISENARKIGDTIIKGFFKTVKSDISQQISELKSNIDSLLIHLRKLAEQCRNKTKQMEADYQRISSRYLKIFNELDHELENRIHAVDSPIFEFTRKLDQVGSSVTSEGLAATTTIGNAENARLHAQISAAISKKSAAEAIRKSERFLAEQYASNDILASCLRKGGEAEIFFTPCCMVEKTDGPGLVSNQLYSSPMLEGVNLDNLNQTLYNQSWTQGVAEADSREILRYFNEELARLSENSTDAHTNRVANLTAQLFDLSQTTAPAI
jgi:hypothetical protein